jgi:hypothetical protein
VGSHLQHFTHSDATRLTTADSKPILVTYKDDAHPLADAVDPAIASAEIASELRRGVVYVRVSVAVTVVTTDVADALVIAWDAFCSAAGDDPVGWEVAAATAQVQPEPP